MCLATIGAIATAGSALMGGVAAAGSANYQAQVAKNNAQVAKQNATYAIEAGQAKAEQASMKGGAQIGAIKAAIAANGVDVNTGSSVDVQASQREENKLTTENVLQDAQLQAYGYRTEAANFQSQAGLYQAQAAFAPIGGALGAIGSFGSSPAAQKWWNTTS